MAQKKLALGSALGFIELIVTTIMVAIRTHGEEVLFSLSEDTVRDLTKKFVDSLVLVSKASHRVLVDYGQTLAKMIAAGKYDYASSDINSSNFPTQGNGQQEVVIELIHYGRDMTTDDVLKDLESKGMRPANLGEVLSFGAAYPEKQRKFPIIALGSPTIALGSARLRTGHRRMPYLYGYGSRRELGLIWDEGRWNDDCRFAAVRK